MRFEQRDDSFREGRDIDSLFLQKEVTADSVTVRILPLSVSQFDEFQNATDRTFSEILELIDGIEFPATGMVCFSRDCMQRLHAIGLKSTEQFNILQMHVVSLQLVLILTMLLLRGYFWRMKQC